MILRVWCAYCTYDSILDLRRLNKRKDLLTAPDFNVQNVRWWYYILYIWLKSWFEKINETKTSTKCTGFRCPKRAMMILMIMSPYWRYDSNLENQQTETPTYQRGCIWCLHFIHRRVDSDMKSEKRQSRMVHFFEMVQLEDTAPSSKSREDFLLNNFLLG